MSDQRPLICGTHIMKPPPKRVPILRWNAELARILWTVTGFIVGLVLSIPFWILGVDWLALTLILLGALIGTTVSQITYQGLTPVKAVRRRARRVTLRKLAQPEGNRAAVYVGCCGPLTVTHRTGTTIRVIPGSRPVNTPLSELVPSR